MAENLQPVIPNGVREVRNLSSLWIQEGRCIAMRCHPEARFWPKDLNAESRLDF